MKVLVLGGTGYLGSKVLPRLIESFDLVVCTQRLNSDLTRLRSIQQNLQFINSDIDSIQSVLKNNSFDWVINMACSYAQGTTLYNSVIESNITFPLSVLNSIVEYGVKNFLTIGTGLPDEFNMYTFSKRMFSEFGRFYSEKHDVNFFNLKLEMFYGSNEPLNRFIPSCISKMKRGVNVPLTFGTQKRDIIHVDDVCDAIMFIINSDIKGYNVISIGTGEGPTVKEIVLYIHELLESNSKLEFGVIPDRPGEPNCIADIDMLNKMGFTIQYQWKDGIKKMIEEESI